MIQGGCLTHLINFTIDAKIVAKAAIGSQHLNAFSNSEKTGDWY